MKRVKGKENDVFAPTIFCGTCASTRKKDDGRILALEVLFLNLGQLNIRRLHLSKVSEFSKKETYPHKKSVLGKGILFQEGNSNHI